MILLSILIGTTIAWLVVEGLRAPEGYQSDERGFVLGPEPVDDAAYRHADRDGFAKFPSLHSSGVDRA